MINDDEQSNSSFRELQRNFGFVIARLNYCACWRELMASPWPRDERINVYISNRPGLSVASSAGHFAPAARSHGQAGDAVARSSEAGALLA